MVKQSLFILTLLLGLADVAWINFSLAPQLNGADHFASGTHKVAAQAEPRTKQLAPKQAAYKQIAKAKAVEDARLAAEQKAASKAKAVEDARLAAEQKAAAEAKAVEDARLAAEQKAAAEAKAVEDARLAAEQAAKQKAARAQKQASVERARVAAQNKRPRLPRNPKNLHFALGRALIDDEARHILLESIWLMKQRPYLHLVIRGHADPSGQADMNQRVSALRAEVVANFIKARGIAPERIETKALGASEPLGRASKNMSEERRAACRRVELRWTR